MSTAHPEPQPRGAGPGGSPPLPSTRRFGVYELGEEIARGGMGCVYRARDTRSGQALALKVLLPAAVSSPVSRRRFELEAEAAALLRHPNVVLVRELGVQNGLPFLVMDLIEGDSVRTRVQRDGPIDSSTAGELCRALADALQHAHAEGVLHRDVKPANILLAPSGAPMLTDFGLARLGDRGDGLTQEGQPLGTPSYMAPEQIGDAGKVDQRADVYGLGATLYFMLVGEDPFVADSPMLVLSQVATVNPAPPSQRTPGVDPDLEAICMKCIEKEPQHRYDTARALAEDLGRYLEGERVLARPLSRMDKAERWVRRNPVGSAIISLITVALLLGGSAVVASFMQQQGRAAVEAAEAERDAALLEEKQRNTEAEEARATSLQQARQTAIKRWSEFEQGNERATVDRIGLAATALDAARTWHTASQDPEAARLQSRAALALSELAIETQEWSLARRACRQAEGLGFDEARVRELLESAEAGVRSGGRSRSREIRRVLDAVVADTQRDMDSAILALARASGPELVPALVSRVDEVSELLRETGAGIGEIESAKQRAKLAAMQGRDLGQGNIRLLLLVCKVLGWLHRSDPEQDLAPAVEALGRYLQVEVDDQRAAVPGRTLVLVGSERALELAHEARLRHGPLFTQRAFRRAEATELGMTFPGPTLRRGLEPTSEALKRAYRAEELYVEGNLPGSSKLVAEALRLDASLGVAWNTLGLVHAEQGQLRQALAAFGKALERVPESQRAEIIATRGHVVWTRGGDRSHALGDAERALRLDSDLAAAWRLKGLAVGHLHRNVQGAITDLTRAVEIDPFDAYGWFALGEAHLMWTRNYRQAIKAFDASLALQPNHHQTLTRRGRAHAASGRFDAALSDASRAILADSENAEAWVERAGLRLRMGDREGGIVDCDRALEVDPKSEAAWANRGYMHFLQSRYGEAISDLSRAIEIEQNFGIAWGNRGLTYFAMGQPENAVKDFQRSLTLRKNQPLIWKRLALTQLQLRRFARAEHAANQGLKLTPKDGQLYSLRARALYGQRKLKEAIASMQEALKRGITGREYNQALALVGAWRAELAARE